MITASILRDLPGIGHGFLTRRGGVSEGEYSSLNGSFSAGDDPNHVKINRTRMLNRLGVDAYPFIFAQQQHTDDVYVVESPISAGQAPIADSLVTMHPGLVLGILTADCAPILLVEPHARVIAAVHAGWRGACGKIVENTLEIMRSLGGYPEKTVAAIGPCIAQQSYEVDGGFVDNLLSLDSRNRCFLISGHRKGHFLFDLAGYIEKKLQSLEITQIEVLHHDTFTEKENFFSYRRSSLERNEKAGRQVSALFIENEV